LELNFVYRIKNAFNKETNSAAAIKILDSTKIKSKNIGSKMKNEISIMKNISHNNIVAVKDILATTSKIYIILEFVDDGNLFDKVMKEGKLTEQKAKFYVLQLLEGLEYCHKKGISHRNLNLKVNNLKLFKYKKSILFIVNRLKNKCIFIELAVR
jgi:serine/threonine protein kinase